MKQTVVPIKGMHCRSCELLVEDELQNVSGIKRVDVSQKKARAVIYGDCNLAEVKQAINRAGYEIGSETKKPWFIKDWNEYSDILYIFLGAAGLYLLAKMVGIQSIVPFGIDQPTGIMGVVLIGLAAGFSTCMALVGGLVISISAKNPTGWVRPHLMFNSGRIIAYAILGGIIGLVGSVFQFVGWGSGLLTMVVAGVMLVLGLQLTGLFPRLDEIKFTLPKSIAKIFGIHSTAGSYSDRQALLMGAATVFLPCGFTQAMQLYAMSTGSFVKGAVIMAAFAIGTMPGLVSLGKISMIPQLTKIIGVTTVLMALFNFHNGFNLITMGNPTKTKPAAAASAAEDTQVITMTQNGLGYSPNTFTIVKNKPVKWVINSTNPYTCAAALLAPKIGINANLQPGENVFTFTPHETGTIAFSCSMGMYRGSFKVVDSL